MHYTKVISALRKFQGEMPLLVGNEMVNFALDNLRKEEDADGIPFKPRSSKARRNRGRRLLMDRGDGERSIRILIANRQKVEITANDYMQAHNVGYKGTVTVRAHARRRTSLTRSGNRTNRTANVNAGQVNAHTRNMNLPRRTFLAPGQRLNKRLVLVLTNRLNKLLR